MRLSLFLALLLWLGLWGSSQAQTRVPLYTYYDEAPFALDRPDNWTQRLAEHLTQASRGKYLFTPTALPRRRLDRLLAQPGWNGVVAWGNPEFFPNVPTQQLRWSHSYLYDADLVVSRRERPVRFQGPPSLYGLRLGAVLGRQLNDFEDSIRAGLIVREDAPSTLSNLKKLRAGRIDCTLIQRTALPGLRQSFPDLEQWLYISPTPRRAFSRHFAVEPGQQALFEFLQTASLQMPANLFNH
ncbi:transporter substrate-binding domain-containing protein [Chitinibacter tainanensis]|uniref:transporter substrate-binding domain-containing protein n=1 Tax=Chitinibacter tainanensis TaxID=230667 RepID=UPI0023556DE2|nr:transporter substrate-binding domain-containing protein [Chitinibacter tainanensis]